MARLPRCCPVDKPITARDPRARTAVLQRPLVRAQLIMLSFLAACGSPSVQAPLAVSPTETPPGDEEQEQPTDSAAASSEKPAQGSSQAIEPEDEQTRRKGLALLDEGKFSEAREVFESLLDAYPGNVSLRALRDAAAKSESDVRSGAVESLANRTPKLLPEPPWKYTLGTRVEVAQMGPQPKLKALSRERNAVVDDEAWFAENDLQLPLWEVPNEFRGITGALPQYVPPKFGNFRIIQAIDHGDHAVLVYGPDFGAGWIVAIVDAQGALTGFFDFSAYVRAPKVRRGDEAFVDQGVQWAEVHDGVLYVSHGHRTYAASSGGMTAYVTALDAASGEVLWRSAPKVSSTMNFVLHEGWIITGYGFTAEPDHLVLLDQRTGKVAKKIKLKTGPDFVVPKGDELYVRTYDMNYVFEL